MTYGHLWTWGGGGGGGGGDLIARKKFIQCPKACVSVQTHSNRSKNKTFTFLGRVMNVFSFSIFGTSKGNENWFEKSDISRNLGYLQCSTEERETTYVSSYRVV